MRGWLGGMARSVRGADLGDLRTHELSRSSLVTECIFGDFDRAGEGNFRTEPSFPGRGFRTWIGSRHRRAMRRSDATW